MTTTKIVKFFLPTTIQFTSASWLAATGLVDKPINIAKEIFTKNILSEDDMTIGLDRFIMVNQDANGNFKLGKGLWKININCTVEMKGNVVSANTYCVCLNLKVLKNLKEINQRASAPCNIDYFNEDVLLTIENDADLISMSFNTRIHGGNALNTTDNVRTVSQSNIKSLPYTLQKLSFIAEKIGDLDEITSREI